MTKSTIKQDGCKVFDIIQNENFNLKITCLKFFNRQNMAQVF